VFYREIQPPPILADFVKLIWIQEFDANGGFIPPERIVTDGIVELVFHFGEPFLTHYPDNTVEKQPTGFAIAQLNKHILIQPRGKIGLIAVRFHPWGAYHFFDLPIREFSEKPISAKDIWRGHGSAIEEQILAAQDNEERLNIISGFLIEQLAAHHKRHASVDDVIRLVQQSRGLLSIKELRTKTGFGERTLERAFLSTIGISPKQFSRITRFLNTCRFIKQQTHKSLTQITYECGYYDQAHLIHEFQQFAGITPKEFFASQCASFFELA